MFTVFYYYFPEQKCFSTAENKYLAYHLLRKHVDNNIFIQ